MPCSSLHPTAPPAIVECWPLAPMARSWPGVMGRGTLVAIGDIRTGISVACLRSFFRDYNMRAESFFVREEGVPHF